MSAPEYLRPQKFGEALALLVQWGGRARLLAGGTDLLIRLRQGSVAPEALIDISALDELRQIERQGDYIVLGALVSHSRLVNSPELATWAPVLARACQEIGSVQIRNRGTLGGNLANASPAGDAILALAALDAELLLSSAAGERWIALSDFYLGPGQTARQSHELLAAVRFRPMAANERCFFNKIGQRRAVRVAKASAAGILALRGGRVERARLALGAVAPTVMRAPRCEEYLVGKELTPAVIEAAAALAGASCTPISDIRSEAAYRCHITGVLARRGLQAALAEAAGGEA